MFATTQNGQQRISDGESGNAPRPPAPTKMSLTNCSGKTESAYCYMTLHLCGGAGGDGLEGRRNMRIVVVANIIPAPVSNLTLYCYTCVDLLDKVGVRGGSVIKTNCCAMISFYATSPWPHRAALW